MHIKFTNGKHLANLPEAFWRQRFFGTLIVKLKLLIFGLVVDEVTIGGDGNSVKRS